MTVADEQDPQPRWEVTAWDVNGEEHMYTVAAADTCQAIEAAFGAHGDLLHEGAALVPLACVMQPSVRRVGEATAVEHPANCPACRAFDARPVLLLGDGTEDSRYAADPEVAS